MMTTTTKKARALWIAINLVCATVAAGSTANQPSEASAASVVVVAEAQRPKVEARVAVVAQEEETVEVVETVMRRLRGGEMTVGLARKAGEIIRIT